MIREILCALGWHKWKFWRVAPVSEMVLIYECEHCKQTKLEVVKKGQEQK